MNQDLLSKIKIPEHWLYWTFLSPDLLKMPLHTTGNQAINIVDPGRLNYDNGPDIRNAILEIDGIVQKGDIEFHLTAEDWFRHGHNEDRRYENLILHVVWDAPQGIVPELLRRFPHLNLSHQIAIPFALWMEKMNLREEQEPTIALKVDGIKTVSFQQLKTYGEIRFLHKVERFQSWLEHFSFEDTLIISLAEAFGYSKNKFPLRELLWENPPSKIFYAIPKFWCSPLGIWVYLSIQANFLTAQSFTRLKIRQNSITEKIHHLFLYFTEHGITSTLQLEDWYFSRVRPANNPIIRVGALAQILFQYQNSSLFKKLLQTAMKRLTLKSLVAEWQTCLHLPFRIELATAIQSIFDVTLQNERTVGLQRINQFIINAVLPLLFLWAQRSGNPGFQDYINALYEEFPACENSKVIQQFGAELSDTSLKKNFNSLAICQQGALELFAEQDLLGQTLLGQAKIF